MLLNPTHLKTMYVLFMMYHMVYRAVADTTDMQNVLLRTYIRTYNFILHVSI